MVLCCALPALNGVSWREREVGKTRNFQLFFSLLLHQQHFFMLWWLKKKSWCSSEPQHQWTGTPPNIPWFRFSLFFSWCFLGLPLLCPLLLFHFSGGAISNSLFYFFSCEIIDTVCTPGPPDGDRQWYARNSSQSEFQFSSSLVRLITSGNVSDVSVIQSLDTVPHAVKQRLLIRMFFKYYAMPKDRMACYVTIRSYFVLLK